MTDHRARIDALVAESLALDVAEAESSRDGYRLLVLAALDNLAALTVECDKLRARHRALLGELRVLRSEPRRAA